MAVQLAPSVVKAQGWLMAPDVPDPEPRRRKGGVQGYARQSDLSYEIGPTALRDGPGAQRMLLAYALGYSTRGELATQYGFSERHIQSVLCGERLGLFTAPVRRRLIANGITNARGNRSAHRHEKIRHALARLSMEAVRILRDPMLVRREHRERIVTDIWLLSGAWREDGP